MGDEIKINKRRGRPFGHRLSEETKDRIRNRRLGTHHSQETKNKISKSLIKYFRKKDSLASSIEHEYSYISESAAEWVHANRDAINNTDCIMTEKRLSYLKQLELNIGSDIEHLFGHNSTPEFLLLLKEELSELFGREKVQELCSLI
jgi:hypothetical protein